MKENETDAPFYSAFADALSVLPTQHPKRTPECPPFSRMRWLTYRPSTRTAKERKHFIYCSYCKGTLQKWEKEAFHVPFESFFTREPLAAELAADIERHLSMTRCESCLRKQRYAQIISYFLNLDLRAAAESVRRGLQQLLLDVDQEVDRMHLGLSYDGNVYDFLNKRIVPPHFGPAQERPHVDEADADLLRARVDEAEVKGKQMEPAALLATGIAYHSPADASRLQTAMHYYRQAIAQSPTTAEGHILLACALHDAGAHDKGKEELQRAVQLLEESGSE